MQKICHKNGNRHDNRIENLEISTALVHGRHHHLKYPLIKRCTICGTEFMPHKTKRERQKTCSPKCRIRQQVQTRLARASFR